MLNPVLAIPDLPSRLPPHNFEAEQALLGAIMANNRALERVVEYLRAEHFAEPLHGRIYETCAILIERNQIANPITLKSAMGSDEDLGRLGGDGYLARLVGAAAAIINASDYGKLIYDLHVRRELIGLGEDVVNEAYDPEPGGAASEQIEKAEARLFELATTGRVEGGFVNFATTLTRALNQAEAAYKRDGKLSGVTSGFRDLNEMLGGLHPSDLIILAGRPAMGKTALATNIAVNAARAHRTVTTANGTVKAEDGALVAFFSLEMSAEQLATRVLAEVAEVPSHNVREGKMNYEDFARLAAASQQLSKLPLYIDDTPALSVSAIRTRARRLHRTRAAQGGLGMIVIDYLQLISGSTTGGRRPENRVQEISEITRALKGLAKELEVPVIALSQLSRAVEQREDKMPQLADLRESGSIEQDADVVLFVYRAEYYLSKEEPTMRPDEGADKFSARYADWQAKFEAAHNKASVIIGKQRHGPTGRVNLYFDGSLTKFADLTEHYDPGSYE